MFIGDRFHPVDDLAVLHLLKGYVRHRGFRGRAVPMLLAGWNPYDIAGADFFDGAVPALRAACAPSDSQRLPERMVCHAVRAPGSKVTWAPWTRAGSKKLNRGLIRTVPVNQSGGPFPDGFEPTRVISIMSVPAVP